MVTIFKTLDVSNLMKVSKQRIMTSNMLMCWSIGKVASQVKMLPVEGKLCKMILVVGNNQSNMNMLLFLNGKL